MRISSLAPALACAVIIAACGGPPAAPGNGASAGAPPGAAPSAPADGTGAPGAAAAAPASTAAPTGIAGRTGELVNPEPSAVVFLYYDLAGIPVPIDTWVEEDSRVKYAPGIDKAAKRAAVRAELEAGPPAVRGVGILHLTSNANLSEYDPAYGEFTVGALAPSSVYTFDALGQKISMSVANGRTAQIWKVPQAESQAMRDKIGFGGSVSMDAVFRIRSVQPGPGGGTLITDVVEYELRNQQGQLLARVSVPPQ